MKAMQEACCFDDLITNLTCIEPLLTPRYDIYHKQREQPHNQVHGNNGTSGFMLVDCYQSPQCTPTKKSLMFNPQRSTFPKHLRRYYRTRFTTTELPRRIAGNGGIEEMETLCA